MIKEVVDTRVDPVEIARAEYRRDYAQRWLHVAVAVAGGMLGGALVLQLEMWYGRLM